MNKHDNGLEEIEMIRLRSKPLTVSDSAFQMVFRLDGDWRPLAYIQNTFEDRGNVVIDHATGLMWQKSGSDQLMLYQDAQASLNQLNREGFAGHTDWRLPTIPELLSLLEPERQSNHLFIHPIFDTRQELCWSADLKEGSAGSAWIVGFNCGHVCWHGLGSYSYVRCVRSWQ